MTVYFENVGRCKASWSANMRTLSYRSLLAQVRPHLKSHNVSFQFNENGTAGAILVGGWRPVGSFRVEDGALITLELFGAS